MAVNVPLVFSSWKALSDLVRGHWRSSLQGGAHTLFPVYIDLTAGLV